MRGPPPAAVEQPARLRKGVPLKLRQGCRGAARHALSAAINNPQGALEGEDLGVRLVSRARPGAVLLTEAGQARAVAGLSDAFDRMAAALGAAAGAGMQRVSDAQPIAGIGGETAGPAARAVSVSFTPRSTCGGVGGHAARRLCARGCQRGNPLWHGVLPGLLTELLLTNEVVPVCLRQHWSTGLWPPKGAAVHQASHNERQRAGRATAPDKNWAMWLRGCLPRGQSHLLRGLRFYFDGLAGEAVLAGDGVAV